MTIFKRRKNPTQTRIVRRSEPSVDASPVRVAAVSTVLSNQRWEVNRGEFRGFDSPPGRF